MDTHAIQFETNTFLITLFMVENNIMAFDFASYVYKDIRKAYHMYIYLCNVYRYDPLRVSFNCSPPVSQATV